MSNSAKLIPQWIRILAGVLGLFALSIGIAGYFKPDMVVHGFAFDSVANQTMGMMFTGRNVALGVALILVAIGGVPESFAVTFIIRFLIELQDLITNFVTGGLLNEKIFVAVLLMIEGYVISRLFKIIGEKHAAEKAG